MRSSLRHLSGRLAEQGHAASPPTVGRLLRKLGYALHVNRKKREAATEQIVALLGADQAASWKEMTGEPFKGPPPQPPFMHGHGKKGPPNK